MRETGRFAPSPTGPLHAGSLVAALASWLDVRARGPQARWLIRIEDADTERCLPGMGEHILRQLADCGLLPDEAPVWQTQRTARYKVAAADWQGRESAQSDPVTAANREMTDDELLTMLQEAAFRSVGLAVPEGVGQQYQAADDTEPDQHGEHALDGGGDRCALRGGPHVGGEQSVTVTTRTLVAAIASESATQRIMAKCSMLGLRPAKGGCSLSRVSR